MQDQEQEQSIEQRIAEMDDFPVPWAKRVVTKKEGGKIGKIYLQLESNAFRIVETPPKMFGQNIKAHGFSKAMEMVQPCKPHDFGTCFVRKDSLRKEDDGSWYVDLMVDKHKARFVPVTTMLVDEDDNPVLDEDGKVQVRTAPRQERWITCELSMIEPVASGHPLIDVYRQSDTRTAAIIRTAEHSRRVAEQGGKRGRAKGKGKRVVLSPDQLANLDLG